MISSIYDLEKDDPDRFRVILITGPQRSGTTFAAKAFSHDMNRPFVDEAVFGVGKLSLWWHIVEGASRCIIQCPSMMKYVHDIPDDCLVVVMRRDVDDIIKSQQRIDWSDTDRDFELKRYGYESGVISQIKYDWWDAHKDEGPKHWVEVEYEQMHGHPMWVPKEQRIDFAPKQTETIDE